MGAKKNISDPKGLYRRPKDEPNLMWRYFSPDQVAFDITDRLQTAFHERNKGFGIDAEAERLAKDEIFGMLKNMSTGNYRLISDIHKNLLEVPQDEIYVAMLVGGRFKRNKNDAKGFASILPIDMGLNPSDFWRHKNSSVLTDDEITKQNTLEFLTQNKKEIIDAGFRYFEADSSRFFFFRTSDLERTGLLSPVDGLDTYALISLITGPCLDIDPGVAKKPKDFYILFDKVEPPTPGFYNEHRMDYHSFRLKGGETIAKKIVKNIVGAVCEHEDRIKNPEDYKDKEKKIQYECGYVIHDIVGHRVVTASEARAAEVKSYLLSSPLVSCGSSKILNVLIKDYYEKPKRRGYRAYNMSMDVIPGNVNAYTHRSELQVIDWSQFFENDINPNSTASRWDHKTSEARISPALKDISEIALNELNKIFTPRTILFEFKKGKSGLYVVNI